jgi:protein gp37
VGKIQWTEETWNPIAGCSMVSPGCTNCYAMLMAARLEAMGLKKYSGLTVISGGRPVWNGEINFDERALVKPLTTKKPTMYFVNSMSDLFHHGVTDDMIRSIFTVMALCPQHTFQVLTKRPERAKDFLNNLPPRFDAAHIDRSFLQNLSSIETRWPLPNVWLGTSCENQAAADARIPMLLRTNAAVRFVSCEPLLGPITFRWASWQPFVENEDGDCWYLDGLRRLDWIIVGGESGPGARPCHLQWIRELVEECAAAKVACFVKQLGAESVWSMAGTIKLRDRKGGDPAEWPEDLRIRQMPGEQP